jgi:hypothetical protein
MTATPEGQPESGTALRDRLEAEIARNKALTAQLATASVVGLKHVVAEDLEGVDPTQMAAKAAELEQSRIDQGNALLAAALEARGLSGADLDTAVKALAGAGATPAPAPVQDQGVAGRVASLGQLGGTPVTNRQAEGLTGMDKVEAFIATQP